MWFFFSSAVSMSCDYACWLAQGHYWWSQRGKHKLWTYSHHANVSALCWWSPYVFMYICLYIHIDASMLRTRSRVLSQTRRRTPCCFCDYRILFYSSDWTYHWEKEVQQATGSDKKSCRSRDHLVLLLPPTPSPNPEFVAWLSSDTCCSLQISFTGWRWEQVNQLSLQARCWWIGRRGEEKEEERKRSTQWFWFCQPLLSYKHNPELVSSVNHSTTTPSKESAMAFTLHNSLSLYLSR